MVICLLSKSFSFFFFNDPATTEIYTLSLHDALPICSSRLESAWQRRAGCHGSTAGPPETCRSRGRRDRKSTRLNSSHVEISYAVFCLKKKKCELISLSKTPPRLQ